MKSAKILLIVFAIVSVIGLATAMDFSESGPQTMEQEFPVDSKTIKIEISDGVTGTLSG